MAHLFWKLVNEYKERNRSSCGIREDAAQNQTRYSTRLSQLCVVYGWCMGGYGKGMGRQMAQEKEGGKKGRSSDSNSSAEEMPSIRTYSV